MIELNSSLTDHFNFEAVLSLEKILRAILPRYEQIIGVDFSDLRNLKITSQVGHAVLSAKELIYYPELCRQLRQIKNYPLYSISMVFNGLSHLEERGIKNTIKALESLDSALEKYRKEKSGFDAEVNNLIMLYGQQKEKPIYNGSKPYFTKYSFRRHGHWCYLVFVSGVKYFNELPNRRHQAKKNLYALSAHDLLKEHTQKNRVHYNEYLDPQMAEIKGLAGGIINTPIFIFRCGQSWHHKGRLYYVDLHTNELTKKLTEARDMASAYAGKEYKIDLWETFA